MNEWMNDEMGQGHRPTQVLSMTENDIINSFDNLTILVLSVLYVMTSVMTWNGQSSCQPGGTPDPATILADV
jgi:hypothetical protein